MKPHKNPLKPLNGVSGDFQGEFHRDSWGIQLVLSVLGDFKEFQGASGGIWEK